MRRKNNYLVAVANNEKLRQRFMPGVPRTFDHDCLSYSRWAFIQGERLFEVGAYSGGGAYSRWGVIRWGAY